MTTTLAQLLTPQTPEQIYATLLGVYQANDFPVQSWQPGGVERTRLMAFATALADVAGGYIPAAAGGGFLDYATDGWLQLTAQELYNILVNEATSTVGNIDLTVAAGAGPYTFNAGDLIATFTASGNRYINTTAGVLPVGPSTTTVEFRAEFTGAKYADPSNSGALISLVTPLPGVTLNNPAGTFSDVAHVGAGTGDVVPSGAPTLSHAVTVRIDQSGQAGITAEWSYSLDGAPYVDMGNALAAVNIGGIGITLTLTSAPDFFAAGDIYTFVAPGTWITTQGSDEESDAALAQRCRDRWSSLSPIPVNNFYDLIARSVPGVGSQVTQVKILPDSVIPGQVNIVVAGPVGPLPPATIATMQTYITPRVPLTDRPNVISPTTQAVTVGGTVTLTASQFQTAKGAIDTAVQRYINADVKINGTVRIAEIIDAVMTVDGAVDVTGVTINGVAANLVLGSSTTFVLPQAVSPVGFVYVQQ